MNSILDQQEENRSKLDILNMSIVSGYIRVWYDTDVKPHYELTEKGIIRLAALMV